MGDGGKRLYKKWLELKSLIKQLIIYAMVHYFERFFMLGDYDL